MQGGLCSVYMYIYIYIDIYIYVYICMCMHMAINMFNMFIIITTIAGLCSAYNTGVADALNMRG